MMRVAGGEVWFDDTGRDLPPLVLLHPGIADSRIWEPLLPELTSRHRVLRYDARGYGRSPAPTAPFTLLRDLVTVLDTLGLEKVPIVGCSQGGGSALGLALAEPARVSALVLLCPGIPGYPVPPDPETDAEFGAAGPLGVDAVAEVGLRLWAAAGRTPEVVELMRSAVRAWIANEGFERDDPPVYDGLGDLAVPASLLVGDADRPWLIAAGRAAAARIPGCELIEVPGVDHLPPLRVPNRVLRQIQHTLARI